MKTIKLFLSLLHIREPFYFLLLITAAILLAPTAMAHGPALEKIIMLSEKIKKDPNDSELYLKRGHIHEMNEHWDEAEADYKQAAKVDPDNQVVDFNLGRLMYNAGHPDIAYTFLNHYIKTHPEHDEALLLRARAGVQLKKYASALQDIDGAVLYAFRRLPEWYIEKADVLVFMNKPEIALEALDEGKKELGDLVTFQSKAIDIETGLKRYDDALSRVDGLLASLKRKDAWLAKRGDILAAAKRYAEARTTYEETLVALESLQPHLRKTPAALALAESVQSKLAKLPVPVVRTSSNK